MTACSTCEFDKPRATPERGGREEDYRAHAQHAAESADHLAKRNVSQDRIDVLRLHATRMAAKGLAITLRDIHGKGPE